MPRGGPTPAGAGSAGLPPRGRQPAAQRPGGKTDRRPPQPAAAGGGRRAAGTGSRPGYTRRTKKKQFSHRQQPATQAAANAWQHQATLSTPQHLHCTAAHISTSAIRRHCASPWHSSAATHPRWHPRCQSAGCSRQRRTRQSTVRSSAAAVRPSPRASQHQPSQPPADQQRTSADSARPPQQPGSRNSSATATSPITLPAALITGIRTSAIHFPYIGAARSTNIHQRIDSQPTYISEKHLHAAIETKQNTYHITRRKQRFAWCLKTTESWLA